MRAAVLLASLLLAACQDEPKFDERYDAAAKEIEARAKTMDADIAASEVEAKAADRDLQEAPAASKAPPSSGE